MFAPMSPMRKTRAIISRSAGHKWFMSAPMCDAFHSCAGRRAGSPAILMPRFRPDGSMNGLRFQRLKDKLGNHSNASSEVEFHSAYAQHVGPEGHGRPYNYEMVQLTRIDCAVGLRASCASHSRKQSHHIRNRSVFQRRLVDQPVMRAVAADLALEQEAFTALVFRLANSADLANDPDNAMWVRVMTPAIKYLVCKTAPRSIYEALECFGGNGYGEKLRWRDTIARRRSTQSGKALWQCHGA